MKNVAELSRPSQSEAMLNEIKGNLFEYLIGAELCRRQGLEASFLKSFARLDEGLAKQNLTDYQRWLKNNDPELYTRLPQLAQKACDYLQETPLLENFFLKNIYVLGKSAAGHGDDSFNECDLLLENDSGQVKPLSVKLCKNKAFVNTKSGGIRSFFSRYFSALEGALNFQTDLNIFLEESFMRMAHDLYEWADLPLSWEDQQAHSKKQFSPLWVEKGWPELPGELPAEIRPRLHAHYQRIIEKVHQGLESLYRNQPQAFAEALAPLVGLGEGNMAQLTCFHKGEKGSGEGRYQLAGFKYYDRRLWQQDVSSLSFGPLKEGISSFEILLSTLRLQIRVKPMNKFTVSGLKVNCSVKTGV